MSTTVERQTLALAAIFQSAALVDKLAKTGQIESDQLQNSIRTILNLNPTDFEDVFNGRQSLVFGLQTLDSALAKNGQGVSREVLQYAMAIIAVQQKMVKRSDLMEKLSKELDRAVNQHQYFNDYLHESVVASTASCYQNSVSQLNFRIRVTGNPTHLQNAKVAERVRAILLFGVRSALLWRQNGGKRWHFMLNRKTLQQTARHLLNVA